MQDKDTVLKTKRLFQGNTTFYTATMKSDKLYTLSQADIIKISKDDQSLYEGIQRELNKSKVNNIVDYLSQPDATFPNSIILNLNVESNISPNKDGSFNLTFKESTKAFFILDGQHRLEGLHKAGKVFDLPVSIFINLSKPQQQEIFTRINSEQTNINPSITVLKERDSPYDTPRKFAVNLAIAFGEDHESSWYQKIKYTGKKDIYSDNGIISIKAFYEPILNLIYDDQDYYLVRAGLINNKNITQNLRCNYDTSNYIFWDFYKNNDFVTVYKILDNYFSAIRQTFSKEYSNYSEKRKYLENMPASLLQKTTGYTALMSLFKDLYIKGKAEGDLSKSFFLNALYILKPLDGKINSDNYPASGLQSSKQLYETFKRHLNI